MATDNPLEAPVAAFLGALTPALLAVASTVENVDTAKLERDVVVEAFNLAAAFIDADGLHTDDELWAFLRTFGPRFESMLAFATPADVRKARILDEKARWLTGPSGLFDLLCTADRAGQTRHAWSYYERSMALAHTVASLDAVPSHLELAAIERFRGMLVRTMELAGVPKPGTMVTNATGTQTAPAVTGPPEEGDLPPKRALPELLAELDELIGLASVKDEVKLVANLIQVQNLRRERGLPTVDASRHMVFTGNPGTGKTTVARLLAEIFRTLGVVEKGHLVETDRSGLVAGYVGQTAIQVKQVVESALEGLLLIDEAYALARGTERDFGIEAIDTLVKLMEDHRDDLVVIAAGYPEEMDIFVNSNPGLRSRFPKTIYFPDYSTDELLAIFESMCKKHRYAITDDARDTLRAFFDAQVRDKGFGNARLSRNLFEAAIARQATRIVTMTEHSEDVLVTLTAADVVAPA